MKIKGDALAILGGYGLFNIGTAAWLGFIDVPAKATRQAEGYGIAALFAAFGVAFILLGLFWEHLDRPVPAGRWRRQRGGWMESMLLALVTVAMSMFGLLLALDGQIGYALLQFCAAVVIVRIPGRENQEDGATAGAFLTIAILAWFVFKELPGTSPWLAIFVKVMVSAMTLVASVMTWPRREAPTGT